MSEASSSPIRINSSDLYSPKVNEFVDMQQALRRDVGPINPQPLVIRIIYSSWFYLSIAAGLGALAAWAINEPFCEITEARHVPDHFLIGLVTDCAFFSSVAAGIGLFLGAAEGLMCRNLRRASICGLVGVGIGIAGGVVAWFVGWVVYGIAHIIMFRMMIDRGAVPGAPMKPTGLILLVQIFGRAAAWAIVAIPSGLGQGIALKEKKVILNGLLGGMLGGLLGGLLFDPIAMVFPGSGGTVSRAIGVAIIGLFVGLFVGLVEGWTKTAWLLMRAGPLAGKQFVMFRDTTVLGSSPKAEIYLFKDEAIEPRHALIYNRGGRFEIEDCNSRDGTYVNGVPIRRQVLNHGDQIVLGKTVLEFQLKESRKG